MTPRERLIVALDVPGASQADALVERLAPVSGAFKVGSQLFTATGPDFVRRLTARGLRVFLDLKYHDIPNTVSQAVAVAGGLGVSLLTVHGLGGREMLAAAVAARPSQTRLLAITMLTSHGPETLEQIGLSGTLPGVVERLARLAQDCGVDGVVASPHEVAKLRAVCGRDFLIVTPGIRPAGAHPADQTRSATPSAALRAGADYLVLGRPITDAADPAAAAGAILEELEAARGL